MSARTDTIFALATPPGRSAIAVIRITGQQAHQAAPAFGVAIPAAGRFGLARLRDHAGQQLDEALLLAMKGPDSSTGEDVLEIHCHGSTAVVTTVLQQLATLDGFRAAEAGEFTHRMFANGRIDLLGVEALADLIDAETDLQRRQAWAQMDGALRNPTSQWRDMLLALAAHLETLIDFADEDLPQELAADLRQKAELLTAEMQNVLDDGRFGEQVRNGVTVALIGPVNAGKSTLLNYLAGRDAAIVSDIAGTTRDIVSVTIDLDGIPVTLLDTAGIRHTSNMIEAEGVKRAERAAQDADAALIVVDGAKSGWHRDINRLMHFVRGKGQVVITKADLGIVDHDLVDDLAEGALVVSLTGPQEEQVGNVIIDALRNLVIPANNAEQASIISRLRHRQAIEAALEAVTAAMAHDLDSAPELAAEDLRHAADSLGKIIGLIAVEDLLDSIFSSFCIGK
jgi:tRNA modification GTPase